MSNTWIAASVIVALSASGLCSPCRADAVPTPAAVVPAPTTPTITTAWANSVRAHLAIPDIVAIADTPQPPSSQPATRPVTQWARSVEAHLADRAHRVAEVGRAAIAWSESGVASWYGGRFIGRRTSSGVRYNPMQLTCAHPTLPLGTKVLVTSDTTGRSVVVTVNDRGPFGGRIVDLSREAASRIGLLAAGTGNVTIEKASPEAIEVADAAESDTTAQALAEAGALDVAPRSHHRGHRR